MLCEGSGTGGWLHSGRSPLRGSSQAWMGWLLVRGRGSVVVDDVEVAAQIAGVLDGRQLACAESCTAGLLMQRLASTDGASRWFRGGVVAYQPATKFGPLEVTPGPVVSKRAAREMAAGVAKLLDAQVAVATTGAAGPEPLEGAPPGTVVVGQIGRAHV